MMPSPQNESSITAQPPQTERPAIDMLRDCIMRITEGTWRFIQLRGEPLGPSCIDGDDVDLLGTQQSVADLTRAAFTWVQAGECHLRISSRKPDKIEWWLFSIDGRHVLRLDLWIQVSQLTRGERSLSFADLQSLISNPSTTIGRLCVDAEACLFVHHLASKRKDLAGESAQHRLLSYADQCSAAGHVDLASMLRRIRAERQLTDADEAQSLAHLSHVLKTESPGEPRSRGLFAALRKLRAAFVAPPRRTSMISIMGCDGAGKTTLAHELKNHHTRPIIVHTGKHLYRKSILYKLAVIFIRPLLRRSRESFDETLAPLVYLRACLALRCRLLFRKRSAPLMLIDRSLIDFLYIDRKTDHPRFSRTLPLSSGFGSRIPTIHCIVRFENILKRKQEMTAAGHTAYDRDMFEHFTQRTPTEYIAFNNDADITTAAAALSRIIAATST